MKDIEKTDIVDVLWETPGRVPGASCASMSSNRIMDHRFSFDRGSIPKLFLY